MATAGESQVLSGKPSTSLKCSGEFFIILNTTFGECLICSNVKIVSVKYKDYDVGPMCEVYDPGR